MSVGYIRHRGSRSEPRCEFERTLKGEYCRENGEVGLDGLAFCNRHAESLRLEERVIYWRAMLAHVDLWSREARGKEREDLVRLLEIERARALTGLGRASEEVEELEDGSGDGRAPPLWPQPFLLGLFFLSGAVIG